MNIVYTTGVWDLFHIGHRNLLRQAAMLGERLIVGVTTDEFTASMKPGRPIIPFEQRCGMLEDLYYVGITEPVNGFLDIAPIVAHNVNIRVVGPTYGRYKEQSRAIALMKTMGIEIIELPRTLGISTTSIIEKIWTV